MVYETELWMYMIHGKIKGGAFQLEVILQNDIQAFLEGQK